MKIKNIDLVEKILEENKVELKDHWTFYRFWSKVDIKEYINQCWPWIASTFPTGYGQFWLYDTMVRAHRLAFELTKGPIKDGLEVQHLCNNPVCCNPNHLELGDQAKNMQYKAKCDRANQKGDNNNNAKLKESHVREIHKLYNEQRKLHPGLKQWQITQPIAGKYGVTIDTIWYIIAGRSWKHIYDESREVIQ